jgi:hypothetical protein
MRSIFKQAKPKITAKKFGGDDCYSWAVFINGRPAFTGLSRGEVAYYRKKAEDGFKDASVAALDKVGYYG